MTVGAALVGSVALQACGPTGDCAGLVDAGCSLFLEEVRECFAALDEPRGLIGLEACAEMVEAAHEDSAYGRSRYGYSQCEARRRDNALCDAEFGEVSFSDRGYCERNAAWLAWTHDPAHCPGWREGLCVPPAEFCTLGDPVGVLAGTIE